MNRKLIPGLILLVQFMQCCNTESDNSNTNKNEHVTQKPAEPKTLHHFKEFEKGKIINGFKSLSEKYGLIFAGSNNSQNGLQPNAYDKIVNDLIGTCKDILNLDEKRVVL